MYKYLCKKCLIEFITRKKGQIFCSKSCSNSYNTSRRKINDISIFENGLNGNSAYVLGLIMSDGCLSYDEHTSRYRITISMNDIEIIETLRSLYSPTKKLYEYQHPKGKRKTYSFITTNEFDIKYLESLGIKERKSLVLKMPKVEGEYLNHIIRGVFDGDGSVYVNRTTTQHNGVIKKYQYINASFTTGSYDFAISLKEILRQNNIKCSIVADSRNESNSWYVKIYMKDSIYKFYNYIYKDSEIYLSRKKEKFEMMI